ncbi:MAG: type II secretion system GspH family protein [Sulfurimonas sp.]|nr:type II secretion system GspH family protein [Sulfurimonas sp.]
MQNSKKAFTMIEMVFVIVVLGILASIAIPKLAATRTDAQITKGIADVSSIRSGIVTERQSRLITCDSTWITKAALDTGSGDFFGGVMMYGVKASTGNNGWSGTAGSGTYAYKVSGSSNTFTYNETSASVTVSGVLVPAGGFVCTAGNECSLLTD